MLSRLEQIIAKVVGHLIYSALSAVEEEITVIECKTTDLDMLHRGTDERVERATTRAADRGDQVLAFHLNCRKNIDAKLWRLP